MRLFCLVLFASLLLASSAWSQDTPPDSPDFEAGDRALLFQIGPNLDLSGLNSTVALKRHRSATSARRFSLGVQGELSGSDAQDRQALAVFVNYLFLAYSRSRTQVHLYYGLGPTAGFRYQDFSDERGNEAERVSLDIGLAGVLGVEWRVHEAIGLTGEYNSILVGTYEHQSSAGGDVDLYGVALRSNGARLGLSVYF
ncbi:MAG: hypothetical protein AAGN64_01205 [Bacteroidota bacterium]